MSLIILFCLHAYTTGNPNPGTPTHCQALIVANLTFFFPDQTTSHKQPAFTALSTQFAAIHRIN